MDTTIFGDNIHVLRKEKAITQEELALAIGVSTQAVSKWECGGLPDIELLPRIADYFQVSIDRLFGRSITDFRDVKTALAEYIAAYEQEDRMAVAFDCCWTIEKALCGSADAEVRLEDITQANPGGYVHSQMLFNSGISLMSLMTDMQYFALLPEPSNGWLKGLLPIEDYQRLFELLGSEDTMRTLFLLYQRHNKPFTPKLLEKNLQLQPEKAVDILEALKSYGWIHESEIELDDAIQKVYNFEPKPALIAVLALAKELIKRPHNFYWQSGCRNAPYLR